jgi:hypothetical protein
MANAQGAFGFKTSGISLTGGIIQTRTMTKAAGYGTAIFPGDLVGRAADGTLDRVLTPGTTLIQGVSLTYGAASTLTQHLVLDNPTVQLIAYSDGILLEADMGLNANGKLGTGSVLLLKSGDVIDSTTEAVGATLDFHLIEKLKEIGNDYGDFVRVLCSFNKHRLVGGSAGV